MENKEYIPELLLGTSTEKEYKIPICDRVIILGGSLKQTSDKQWVTTSLDVTDDKKGTMAFQRVLAGAIIYAQAKEQGRKITFIVSTGKTEADTTVPTEAQQMKEELISMGVPASIIATESMSDRTITNASEVTSLVKSQPGPERYLLVTNAYHRWRAKESFDKVGFESDGRTLLTASAEDIIISEERRRRQLSLPTNNLEQAFREIYINDKNGTMKKRIQNEVKGRKALEANTYR